MAPKGDERITSPKMSESSKLKMAMVMSRSANQLTADQQNNYTAKSAHEQLRDFHICLKNKKKQKTFEPQRPQLTGAKHTGGMFQSIMIHHHSVITTAFPSIPCVWAPA